MKILSQERTSSRYVGEQVTILGGDMRGFQGLFVGAVLITLLSVLAAEGLEAEKCAPRPDDDLDPPEVVTIVDGEVVTDSALHEIPRRDLDSVEIICWDRAEKFFGVRVRRGAVVVFTKSGVARAKDAVRANLATLIDAQDAYFAEHGAYASNVASLPSYESPRWVEVYLMPTGDGWTGRTRHELLRDVCYVFSGTEPERWIPNRPKLTAEIEEQMPVCVSGAELVSSP